MTHRAIIIHYSFTSHIVECCVVNYNKKAYLHVATIKIEKNII